MSAPRFEEAVSAPRSETAMSAPRSETAMSASRFAGFLRAASVEVSSRTLHIDDLRECFAPGIDVTLTALPGEDYQRSIAIAMALRKAGFNPVPHMSARDMPSHACVEDFLQRAAGEAGVRKVVVIGGDLARPRGPYGSSLKLLQGGGIERAGITHVSIGGHPEGHPHIDQDMAMQALADKQAWGLQAGVKVDILTQFCFEAQPFLDWLAALQRQGVTLPVRIGLAGPASPATLLRFALRCGIGNSLKALRSQISRFGRLLSDADPSDVLRGLEAAPQAATAQVAGFHLFPFGGLRKAAGWLAELEGMAPLSPQ